MLGQKLIQVSVGAHLAGRGAWDLGGWAMRACGLRGLGGSSAGAQSPGSPHDVQERRLVHATSRPAQWSVAADLGCVPPACAEDYGNNTIVVFSPFMLARNACLVQIAAEAGVSTRTLAKPKMRGLLRAAIQFHVTVGFILAALGGLAFKVFVADVRKQRYADFYRNYDAQKEFEVMRKKGLFQSC